MPGLSPIGLRPPKILLATIRGGLRVAIGAQEPQVREPVIPTVAVDVIELKRGVGPRSLLPAQRATTAPSNTNSTIHMRYDKNDELESCREKV